MTSYNAIVEIGVSADEITEDWGDAMIERFLSWHPAIGVSSLGRAELVITLAAETLRQAVEVVSALTDGLDVVRTTVETTEDFDRRGMADIPALLSVSEVASAIGVTRAAVQKRINSGSIPATKVGATWAVPVSALGGV
ncbi:MAG: helix-turn-helix domain-containing protein [Propionibacteriaceae bacterium]|nr:helix-turn-helix domain-containing protein [Propionibacteriaceae bacterium]